MENIISGETKFQLESISFIIFDEDELTYCIKPLIYDKLGKDDTWIYLKKEWFEASDYNNQTDFYHSQIMFENAGILQYKLIK